MSGRYRLIGSLGSPYSRKMRAIMRYRRLPHDWVLRTERNRDEFAHLKPALVPVLQYPDSDQMKIDSTPLAYDLEARHAGRSIMPDDPCNAFLSHMIEDMADEWLTKAMFHYRWANDADIKYASHWIADDSFPDHIGAQRAQTAKMFAERQVGRMPMVGCTPENAPVIESSYLRLLALLEELVGLHSYLFGSRPALADFGLFGQLIVLATDPTPQALMRKHTQRTEDWLRQLDDASGVEGDWLPEGDSLPEATLGILAMAGDIYLPFLSANANAAKSGESNFSLKIMGMPYAQGTFGYQVKCLTDLRERFAALTGEPRDRATAILESCGTLSYLV
ncbi:MAG: glutathione S-transferase [Alphaproteobacteria bacterium]|nr:glutathione S-transferase [Alphaproteobacteria bacterium]